MESLNNLAFLDLNDKKLNENNLVDNTIKEFLDSLFYGNTFELFKYKYPKLYHSFNELTNYYDLLHFDSSLNTQDLKVEIAKKGYDLVSLDERKEELKELDQNIKKIEEAKKVLINKKEYYNKLIKKDDLIDNLKDEIQELKNQFNESYTKVKAIKKILANLGYRSTLSEESMKQLKDEINLTKTRIESLEENTQIFDEIETEEDLIKKINYLTEELKNYKDMFIKPEDES